MSRRVLSTPELQELGDAAWRVFWDIRSENRYYMCHESYMLPKSYRPPDAVKVDFDKLGRLVRAIREVYDGGEEDDHPELSDEARRAHQALHAWFGSVELTPFESAIVKAVLARLVETANSADV